MASLVKPLASGFAAAPSGKAYFYQPGTLIQATVTDEDGTPLAQPLILDVNGAYIAYTTDQRRLIVQTSAGVTVADIDPVDTEEAKQVKVDNASFTSTTIDGVLTAAGTSLKGKNWQYAVSTGNGMAISTWMTGLVVNVKAMAVPAVGDGITDDTAAIQAALDYVGTVGGGTVYLPPGTYLISAQLALASKNSVRLAGAGPGVTTIKASGGTQNGLSFTTCNQLYVHDLSLSHSATTTGFGINVVGCHWVVFDRVVITAGDFATGIEINESGGTTSLYVSILDCQTAGITRGIRVGNGASAANVGVNVIGGSIATDPSGTASVELKGLFNDVTLSSVSLDCDGVNFLMDSGFAGKGVLIEGSRFGISADATTDISLGPASGTITGFVERDNSFYVNTPVVTDTTTHGRFESNYIARGSLGNAQTISGVGTFTPNLDKGRVFRVTGDNALSNITVAAPSSSATIGEGVEIILVLITTANTTGWNVTAYTNDTAITTTTTTGKTVIFRAVYTGAKWRIYAASSANT